MVITLANGQQVQTDVAGLVSCPYCQDGKRYTPAGLQAHSRKAHQVIDINNQKGYNTNKDK
jgi:hypothetical protein